MKYVTQILTLGLFALLSLTFGCGKGLTYTESQKLPNRRVPLTTKVLEAVQNADFDLEVPPPGERIETDGILREKASFLGHLSEKEYLRYQNKWVGSDEEACNFFLITALCEAGYCKKDKPFYRAAEFGKYFEETGWTRVTLAEAKQYLERNAQVDLVAQRGSRRGSMMGHVAVPVELNSDGSIEVAQGNYHVRSHQMETWGETYASEFNYYLHLPLAAASAGVF